jgi:hypothetical protein
MKNILTYYQNIVKNNIVAQFEKALPPVEGEIRHYKDGDYKFTQGKWKKVKQQEEVKKEDKNDIFLSLISSILIENGFNKEDFKLELKKMRMGGRDEVFLLTFEKDIERKKQNKVSNLLKKLKIGHAPVMFSDLEQSKIYILKDENKKKEEKEINKEEGLKGLERFKLKDEQELKNLFDFLIKEEEEENPDKGKFSKQEKQDLYNNIKQRLIEDKDLKTREDVYETIRTSIQ